MATSRQEEEKEEEMFRKSSKQKERQGAVMSVFAESIDIPTFENCFARTRNDSPQMTPPIQSCAPKPEFRVCRNWGSKKKKEWPPPSARHSPLHFRIYVEDSFRRLWEERGEHIAFPPICGCAQPLVVAEHAPKKQQKSNMQSKYLRVLAAVLVVAATSASAENLDVTRCVC